MSVILTPDHPRWNEFAERLEGPEGCAFTETPSWRCYGGHDKHFAKAILESMRGIDVEGTLRYFDEHGGHCDCEILFNIDLGG